MRKLTHEEIVARQVKKSGEKRLPFCVVLNNIRSLHNVGAIFRTADGAGAEKIWAQAIPRLSDSLDIWIRGGRKEYDQVIRELLYGKAPSDPSQRASLGDILELALSRAGPRSFHRS